MSLTAKDILDFWFVDHTGDWWAKNEAFDAEVRSTFSDLIEAIGSGKHDAWMNDPDGCLAAIIVLDQFTRNAFRGTAAMYTHDTKARAFSKHAIACGWDLEFDPCKRAFVYMPLEHSEADDDQVMSIACFARFAKQTEHPMATQMLDYAHKHKAVVDRFSRYPHRNDILGRPSTEEEIAFLKEPGSSF